MRAGAFAHRLTAAFAVIISLFCASIAQATTVSWGSEMFSDFRDSNGNPLDETFTIQLGFFEDVLGEPFTPASDNISQWVQQWKVFDQASLNIGLGYFTSEANVNADGTSGSPFGGLGINFTGQEAYIWIRNGTELEPGTEWFLAGAPSWTFPVGSDDPHDLSLSVQWSTSDLDPEAGNPVTPIWGGQSGNIGSGSYAMTDSGYTLQTFTFIPEPSAPLLTLMGTFLLLIRRRREE